MKTEKLAAEAIDIAKATGKDWDWNDFAAVAEEIEAEENQIKEEIKDEQAIKHRSITGT